jgi:hypothetical protein
MMLDQHDMYIRAIMSILGCHQLADNIAILVTARPTQCIHIAKRAMYRCRLITSFAAICIITGTITGNIRDNVKLEPEDYV